jgi:YVTN family beta-propeller protein
MNHASPPPAPQPLCSLFEPLLPLLSQGQLDASEAAATRDHVATCAWCQQQLRELDFLRDTLRRLEARDTAVSAASTYLPLSRGEIRAQFLRAPTTEITIEVTTEITTEAPARAPVRRPLPKQPGRFIPIAAVAAVLLIAVFAGTLFGRFTNRTGAPQPGATPSIGRVTATISGLGTAPEMQSGGVSGGTFEVAATDDAVWVHNGDTGVLLRIDPRTNTIVARIHVGHGDGGVTIGQEAVWVANPSEGTVSRIDPQTNAVVATITVGSQDTMVAMATSPGAVWATDLQSDTLIRIDPQTNAVVARLTSDQLGPAAARGPIGVSFGAGAVWLCEHLDSSFGLTRLDPQSNQVQAQVALNESTNWVSFCTAVVAVDKAVWALTSIDDSPDSVSLIHIDPASNKVIARIEVRADPFHFAADARGVWVISPHEGLARIDPKTNRVVGNMTLPGAAGVAIGAGAVWVADGQAGALLRITPAP